MRFTFKQIQNSTARIASTSDGKPLAATPATGAPRVAQMLHPRQPKNSTRGLALARRQTPHDILWDAVEARWPGIARREHPNAVPGRRFRIDIAFPEPYYLAIEIDGWQFHGMRKGDFIRDRERQNLLCLHGWRILRFSAGMIRMDLERQVAFIALALAPDAHQRDLRTFSAKLQHTRKPHGNARPTPLSTT